MPRSVLLTPPLLSSSSFQSIARLSRSRRLLAPSLLATYLAVWCLLYVRRLSLPLRFFETLMPILGLL
jgi:hypothetical protein